MTQLVINIEDDLARALDDTSRKAHVPKTSIVTDALRRWLGAQWLERSNALVSKRAKELGLPSEDDLLNSIS